MIPWSFDAALSSETLRHMSAACYEKRDHADMPRIFRRPLRVV